LKTQPDFLVGEDLAELTTYSLQSLYNQKKSGVGPLAGILTKFGGKFGAWRADYEALIDSQRRLKPNTVPPPPRSRRGKIVARSVAMADSARPDLPIIDGPLPRTR
jgi:hypothetical protein